MAAKWAFVVVVLLYFFPACSLGDDLQALYMRGLQEHARGDLKAAESTFSTMVSQVGQYLPNVYVALCVVKEQLFDKEGAVTCYFEAREYHPQDDTLNLSFCRYLATLFNSFQATFFPVGKALDACFEYQKSKPNDPDGYHYFASIYNGWRKYDLAHEHYIKAISFSNEEEKKLSILEDLVFSELRAGKLMQTNAHALELLKRDQKRGTKVIPHIFTISRPGDERISLLKDHIADYVSECTQVPQCSDTSQFDIIWRWEDLVLPSARAGLPVSSVELVNPKTQGELFGEPMPNEFYSVDDDVIFGEHKLFHVTLTGGILYGREALVRFGCKFVFGNYAEWTPTMEMCPDGAITVKPLYSRSPILSTYPQYNPTNYFHWLIEGLVRLIVLLNRKEWDNGFSVLVPSKKSYILESLELLGIQESQTIVFEQKAKDFIEVKSELHMIDWESPPLTAYSEDSWSQYYVSRHALRFARETFHDILRAKNLLTKGKNKQKANVLYVSRRPGEYSIRDIKNEPELKAILEATARKHGANFQVHTGDETFLEQMQLFERADVVVGAHGAGLANLLFSHEKTSLIMFPLKPRHDHTYEYISRALNFDIYLVEEVTSYYYSNFGTLSPKKMHAAAETLSKALLEFDSNKEEL